MVNCFHGNGNVRNLIVYSFFCIGQRLVGIHEIAVLLVGLEVFVPILPNESAEPLPHI